MCLLFSLKRNYIFEMVSFFSNIKDNRLFQFSVVTIIILNAILIGATTYKLDPLFLETIHFLDYVITIFFVIEILIRFIGEPIKSNFFKSGWNIFDTIIVTISLIPIPNNSSFLVLRLLRVFRVLRLISVIPELKQIIEAILQSIKRVFFVSLLLFIILYIYATMGAILFSEDEPSRWGDLGISLITLFQVLTLSSWETVMLPLQEIYWWTWIYFFSFIIICAITILNLVIAILVDVVIQKKL
jgi:voltage-gated sodium channel